MPEGYAALVGRLPPISLFRPSFGVARRYGHAPPDRYILRHRNYDPSGVRKSSSAPGFDELETVYTSRSIGNSSFLFRRTQRSWHGVLPLACPPGAMRKVFIVTINRRRTEDGEAMA